MLHSQGNSVMLADGMKLDHDYSGNSYSIGRKNLDDYMYMRRKAMEDRSVDPDNLDKIHASTGQWIEENFSKTSIDYTKYDKQIVIDKMIGLANFLKKHHRNDVADSEIAATELFIEAAFGMYEEFSNMEESEIRHSDADGSFAFVVPMRVSRYRKDYGHEVEMISPILRYIPNEHRAMFAVGLPPLILDQYEPTDRGSRGYLVLAPIFTDSMFDIPETAAQNATDRINDAVDFANKRLGARVTGLGAVLPAITSFGNTIENEEVITTTGHAGTVYMIDQTIRQAVERGYVQPEALSSIGFLGLGSIGRSAAEIITENFPEASVSIFDAKAHTLQKGAKALEDLGREYYTCKDVKELLQKSTVLVSAITSTIDLDDIDPNCELDLTGKIIVDDSQPGSFDRKQVEARGGKLTWVIAHDTKGVAERTGYDYGTLADPRNDIFGCEAEAASLAQYYNELCVRGFGATAARSIIERVAVREPVTAKKARLFGALFKKYGIIPAPFQVYGEYVEK